MLHELFAIDILRGYVCLAIDIARCLIEDWNPALAEQGPHPAEELLVALGWERPSLHLRV